MQKSSDTSVSAVAEALRGSHKGCVAYERERVVRDVIGR